MKRDEITRREFVKGAAVAAAGAALGGPAAEGAMVRKEPAAPPKILNFNENMEYRRLGKTGIRVSAVCLGGHWKRLKARGADFEKNRSDVVSKCIEVGINYIDACTGGEVMAYSKALQGRREKMYLGYSWYEHEMRFKDWQSTKKLLEGFDEGLKGAGLEYVDLWRITMYEPGGRHTQQDEEETMAALEKAQKDGKARFVGISSHDRKWLKKMIETYPQLQVFLTPYTAASREKPKDSLFEAVRKCDVGVFGIKPFASNSLFKGDSQPENPNAKDDDEKARLAIRYILCNDAITAPIPGLINLHQVENVARAVQERRKLDQADARKLEEAAREMWARLPPEYEWLRDWECV